jgi:hypothetical protein
MKAVLGLMDFFDGRTSQPEVSPHSVILLGRRGCPLRPRIARFTKDEEGASTGMLLGLIAAVVVGA